MHSSGLTNLRALDDLVLTYGVPSMKLKVLIHPAKEGGFCAEIPALSGCVSEKP